MTPLQQQITDLWGQITAATHRFLELIAELDDRNGWNHLGGIMSCAHWLNIYCGIGMVAARERVRVAHAIRRLPELHSTAAHVELTVQYYRKVERLEEAARAAAAHRDRHLQFRYESDEQQAIHAVLPVKVAEFVRQAIDRAVELLERVSGDSAELRSMRSIGSATSTSRRTQSSRAGEARGWIIRLRWT
jgi:hypothetical protein